MKMKFFLALIVLSLQQVYADVGLKELLSAIGTNESYQSQLTYQDKAKKEHESSQKTYLPTVDMIAGRDSKFERASYEPKNSDYVGLRTSYILFDGFKREGKISSQKSAYDAQTYKSEFTKQQLMLDVIREYYTLQSAKSGISVLNYKIKELNENIKNITVLVTNDLTTKDKLQAIVASQKEAEYDLESMKLQLESSRLKLLQLTGLAISMDQDQEYLNEASKEKSIARADIEADKHTVKSLEYSVSQYTYMPTISLQYDLKNNAYSSYDDMAGSQTLSKHSNDLSLQFSFPLFDFGKISKDQEAARLGVLALSQEIAYKEKTVKTEKEISERSLEAARTKLNAANAAFEATSMAYEYAKKRFSTNLISHTEYLSELTKKEEASYRCIAAKNEIELKKAEYAFTVGTDLMTLVGAL